MEHHLRASFSISASQLNVSLFIYYIYIIKGTCIVNYSEVKMVSLFNKILRKYL